ncbi:hypothetical protein K1719_043955 [Acacia pycnantha]|nr:hypothetical protein K1719_043955 [Acacia pycnantha]
MKALKNRLNEREKEKEDSHKSEANADLEIQNDGTPKLEYFLGYSDSQTERQDTDIRALRQWLLRRPSSFFYERGGTNVEGWGNEERGHGL